MRFDIDLIVQQQQVVDACGVWIGRVGIDGTQI